MRVTLSSKQYNMLRIILSEKVFTQAEAAKYLQPTFSSMANPNRNYLMAELNHKTGEVEFHVTKEAREAMALYEHQDVYRSSVSDRLSVFLERYVRRSQRRSMAS